jgi:hypothetical protein
MPGNIIFVTRVAANPASSFLVNVRYNRRDAKQVPLRQVMVLGFEYTDLYFDWPAITNGAVDLVFGTEI